MGRNGSERAPRRWIRDPGVLVLSLLALSCDLLGTAHTFEDEGKICLYPGGSEAARPFGLPAGALRYEANGPLELVVTMVACMSSSCSHDERATCSALVDGNVIRVQSSASYVEEGTTCTADCQQLAARCSIASLPAGTYEIRHGNATLPITIPSTVTPPCAGTGLGGS